MGVSRPFYTFDHLATGTTPEAHARGVPGEFPFTRGIQPTMYRGRLWTMRQYAGFGTAAASNKRYRYLLSQGVSGLSIGNMREYLQYIADRRLEALQLDPIFGSRNPFDFMELQDVQELTNFFERRVSSYQVGVTGDVAFSEDF